MRARAGVSHSLDISACRREFPALGRSIDGRCPVFFDGPAGSQVPQRVIDAMADYLVRCNANHGGAFATSRRSDELLSEAHRAVADLLGTSDPDLVVFGPNMTTLTFALSRALGRTWGARDEILVCNLEHDANFTPWVLAARDAGATVRCVDLRADDCTIDLEDLDRKLSGRTRLLAVSCASNAVGTVHPVEAICARAHEAGAQVFLDAVHFAPHARMDVTRWDCDFLACSAYKFFGPHVGVLYGKRRWLTELEPYKLRPAGESLPDRWMTGTQNHEGIAGTLAAVEYLADLGRRDSSDGAARGEALSRAYDLIGAHERALSGRLLRGLDQLGEVRAWGITAQDRLAERVPTVSITHAKKRPEEIARVLAERGIFVWHGNFYALPLTQALDLEPDGMVRIGLLHYNTQEEVDRLLEELASL